MPNFRKICAKYDKDAALLLQELVKIDSTYDEKTVTPETPYGKGVDKALSKLLEVAKSHGFKVEKTNNRCAEIIAGEEGPIIGVYAHLDVVPASGKWDNPPFAAKVIGQGKQAKMIGRGTSDDKGPLVAAYYAMKALKDEGLINGYRVRLVAGGDEERGSSCLSSYFESGKEQAKFGFTPDADFPLIYAEKGIIHGTLVKMVDLSPIIAISGGTVVNAVADKVMVTLSHNKAVEAAFKSDPKLGDYSHEGELGIALFKGKSAHASTPELGESAFAKAFLTLGKALKMPLLEKLGLLISSTSVDVFGGDDVSKELGASTYSYGLCSYDSNKHVLKLSLDYRYGESASPKQAIKKLEDYSTLNFVESSSAPILLFDKKSDLVSTLMKSYRHMTHRLFDKPMAIGGGTYAKEAKNTVAYGSAFKGHPGDIHSPNEYIYLDDLYAQIGIYADAIFALGKKAK